MGGADGGGDGWSLERRLLGGLSAVLALLAVGFFFLTAGYARRAADAAYDRLLLASALSMADAVRLEEGRITFDLPYASLAILGTDRRDRVFYRIAAPDGSLVTGYPELGARLPLARSDEPRFVDVAHLDASPRAVVLGRLVAGPGGGWVTVVVAQTRAERIALGRQILANAFAPVLLLVVIATLLIWYGVHQALRPLDRLERTVSSRDPSDLSPIEAPAPREVRQLVGALNLFTGRLQASLRHMQSFVADAAHQIRTPLASLHAQAELAAEEEDPELLRGQVEKIRRNAAVASRLTNQLLSHAMVTFRHELPRREAVDLAALARQTARRAEAGADEVAVRVDEGGLAASALVAGDLVTLGEAVANLVDNAAKYAGACGPIEIRLERPAGGPTLRLEVADRGSGVPDADKARVLERFGRGSTAGDVVGSGLGLAIVREVADAHGAALSLLDRPGGGLVVRLDFPAADPGR
jgi:two-component system, OmpR family, sensor histidine kinase TctE